MTIQLAPAVSVLMRGRSIDRAFSPGIRAIPETWALPQAGIVRTFGPGIRVLPETFGPEGMSPVQDESLGKMGCFSANWGKTALGQLLLDGGAEEEVEELVCFVALGGFRDDNCALFDGRVEFAV
jgi:hypothetical protein